MQYSSEKERKLVDKGVILLRVQYLKEGSSWVTMKARTLATNSLLVTITIFPMTTNTNSLQALQKLPH